MSSQRQSKLTSRIRTILEDTVLPRSPGHDCGYLPGQTAVSEFLPHFDRLPSGYYHGLMDHNFRRSGKYLYRMRCPACQECKAIRVPVDEFVPNRSQRRCLNKNQDLDVEVVPSSPSSESYAIYERYIQSRHSDGSMDGSWEEFTRFLYDSPVETSDLQIRLAGRLVAVGVIDIEPVAVSTVYCYFDPDLAPRGLGIYNVLKTIEYCRSMKRPWLYLGLYIGECGKMNYKMAFKPNEVLQPDNRWTRTER